MQDSLYVALSSQIALERRLDTIADNVANASTIGFRATGVKFEDVVSGSGPQSVSFASSGKTYLSGAHGAMTQTGNPFDFAVQGDAWFGIDTPAGTVMTRDGRFSMNENGELTRLIMVQRAFENTAALMRQTDATTDDAIKTLGSKS